MAAASEAAWYRRALSRTRDIHVSREARWRFGLSSAAFVLGSDGPRMDLPTVDEWANRMAGVLSAERGGGGSLAATGAVAMAGPGVTPGVLAATFALHEAARVLIARIGGEIGDAVHGRSVVAEAYARWLELDRDSAAVFPHAFLAAYSTALEELPEAAPPGAAPEPLRVSPAVAPPLSDGADALEEAWLIAAALRNPGSAPVRPLFEEALTHTGGWGTARRHTTAALARVPLPGRSGPPAAPGDDGISSHLDLGAPIGADELDAGGEAALLAAPPDGTLLWLLTLPVRTEPHSLGGQLRVALERWGPYLRGDRALDRALRRAVDLLMEEGKGARGEAGVAPAPPPPQRSWSPTPQSEGPARFTADRAWMPQVVMVAKSTYVWLAQLGRRYGRSVRRLDEVPDAALAELNGDGFNALWLIGLWQRSEASRALKHARGQVDAGASAYSLYDYEIADDLGGWPALEDLKRRAAAAGIRLASDMVPNHTGLDSRWMLEHPDWFLQLDQPPFPGYRFSGPNLSGEPRMEVRVEDGYYDGTDAAVVFERLDVATGERRYVYHGNDGTAMPWNDTAQLDYLRPEVRDAVKRTIEHVAGSFPIIRFDAAMTLAKRHVQRLWHPKPGEGGAVPSRARFGVDPEEFERLMPREFWRELVDEMALVAPDTLLLAEAFWLLEGYFVRELGMHRVYNSAFMHMLLKEENAGYRRLLKTFAAFDPRVLERFVNFMSNPDEESARTQFGAGEKYFGVTTLLATLPGLPMFGHGQVEGLSEKYGMEYLAPRLDEGPDERLVQRHRQEITPLLRARAAFAGAESFRLFDLIGAAGVEEAAFVFTNRPAPVPGAVGTLVAFNNSAAPVSGAVRASAPFADPLRGGGLRSETLAAAFGFGEGSTPGVRFERFVGPAESRRVDAAELKRDGLRLELGPYETQVWLVWRSHEPTSAPPPAATPVASADRPSPARGRGQGAVLGGDRGAARRRAAKRRRR